MIDPLKEQQSKALAEFTKFAASVGPMWQTSAAQLVLDAAESVRVMPRILDAIQKAEAERN